ncbi:MAG: outer membrane lipoprotein-sorting protein [Flavobacteriaceae bacterium]|jgi:outer membrane lipoprotein-sorting protein|tara:strand:+ start:2186 stop:2827 length:642 start_codon:yes stop_codon:yes gene_type:complete
MRKIYFLSLTIAFSGIQFLKAQTSTAAKNLLDEVSLTIAGYETMIFDFSYVLENRQENIKQETSGSITVKGEKYKLMYLGVEQLYDGEKTYTIVPENEEITIITEKGDDFGINPTELLNFYKEGYDYQWDIKQSIFGRPIQFVKLLPSNENNEVKYLLLGIDMLKKNIYRLIEIGVNGTRTTLTISNQETNTPLVKDYFTFDPSLYPDYYINN